VPRPSLDIDPDWLRERFKMPGATAREIAAEIGHHPSTISSHAHRLGIRLRAP
jgi:IS30 family transposase